LNLFTDWFKRSFSDPQVVILGLFLIIGLAIIIGLGKWLAPMFASLVIAYLLEGIVARLRKLGMSRILAVTLVFVLFLAVLVFLLFGLVPMLSRQLTQLVQQFPNYISQGQILLAGLLLDGGGSGRGSRRLHDRGARTAAAHGAGGLAAKSVLTLLATPRRASGSRTWRRSRRSSVRSRTG
jgi:predicted PurR-regulated permease PerM